MKENPKQNGLGSTSSTFAWPSIYLLSLCQVVGLWSIAPLWQCVFVAVLVVLRWRFIELLGKNGRLLLTLSGGIWFFLYYGLSFTVEIAASFLWLAASLKLLELRSRRDLLLYVYVMLYVSAVSTLFDQGILHALLQLLVVLLCISVLLRLHGGNVHFNLAQFRAVGTVFALALPIVIVLFVFFPRIGPLWTIPVKASSATTGMSDSMSPGDIANLVNSDERVFRASFSGSQPPQSALYWRGLVLDRFDGRRWSRHPRRFLYSRPGKYDLGRDMDASGAYYQVLLEPHNQLWVYALEGSSSLSSHVKQKDMALFELAVEAIQAADYRMAYEAPEFIGGRIPTAYQLRGVDRRSSSSDLDLQVPAQGNPRTRSYIRELRQGSWSDADLLAHLLAQFREQSFTYSLQPPLLGQNFVDEFMFEIRTGFCSHFAGSLAYMLRLAGIPARVVIGYQGGEFVPNADYLLVREYDAHAWVEAKIDSLGWVRVDPTAMVAPDRIEQNLERALAEEGSFLQGNLAAQWRNDSSILAWASLQAELINYQWQKWVINYSQADQVNVFKKLLVEYSLTRVALLFVAVFVIISLAIWLLVWLRAGRSGLSRVQRRYLRRLSLLSILGYARQNGETPRAYLERMQGNMPDYLYARVLHETQKLEEQEYKSQAQS